MLGTVPTSGTPERQRLLRLQDVCRTRDGERSIETSDRSKQLADALRVRNAGVVALLHWREHPMQAATWIAFGYLVVVRVLEDRVAQLQDAMSGFNSTSGLDSTKHVANLGSLDVADSCRADPGKHVLLETATSPCGVAFGPILVYVHPCARNGLERVQVSDALGVFLRLPLG